MRTTASHTGLSRHCKRIGGDLLNTCSWCPLRTCKLMPCVPSITLHPGNREEFCKAEIERVIAVGGPSGVLLGGKGIENHSGYLGTI
jgi:hypothetical protein